MDQPLKQRLIGAAVLAALAVIFLPMLLKGPDVRTPDAEEVPLTMPATPGTDFETRELPLTVPEPAPPGGVLGLDGKPRPADATAPAGPGDNTVAGDAVAALGPEAAGESTTPAPASTPAPAATPGSPANAPVGAGGGDFVVTMGVFGDVGNAQSLATKLRAAGLPVRTDAVPVAGKQGVRLRVGPYPDRAAAEAGRLRAQTATNVSGKVIALDGAALPPAPAAPAAPVVKPAAPVAKPAPSTTPSTASTAAAAPAVPASPAKQPPTPAVATPPSSGGAPATVSAGFAVQLSAPAAEADANVLRDKARAAGFPSFVQRVEAESGTRYRVRIGPFADRGAADAARDAANAKLGTHGIVMRHP